METLLTNVRNAFLERAKESPDNYDECDIEKVRVNDFTVRRFIGYNNNNFKDALQQLDDAMKWRKSYGVNRLDFSSLCIELYKCGGAFIYNNDREGRPLVYLRVKALLKNAKLTHIFRQFCVIFLDKTDSLADDRGFGIILDFTDAGLKNADIRLATFVINVIRRYYPESVSYVLLYKFPRILAALLPVARLVLGHYANKLIFVNENDIFKYIDRVNVPKYLGGDCETDFTIPPPECTRYAEDFTEEFQMTTEEIRKYIKLYEPLIKEAQQLVRCKTDIENNNTIK